MLITTDALNRSLTDNLVWDAGLAEWAISTVSDLARDVAGQPAWSEDTVPDSARAIIGMAARRLYTNPDRFTREASGDYSYALDSSVTSGDIFTPRELVSLQGHRPGRRRSSLSTLSTTREPGAFVSPSPYPDRGRTWFGGA